MRGEGDLVTLAGCVCMVLSLVLGILLGVLISLWFGLTCS
jgi:hypothetical protein